MAAAKKYWEMEPALETGEPEPVEEYPAESRVVAGSIWMFSLLVLLFFLPVVNGVIAGAVGGYRVASPRNALMAALGPITLGSCMLWMLMSMLPIPLFGFPPSQIADWTIIGLADMALLLGAGVGATIAESRLHRAHRA